MDSLLLDLRAAARFLLRHRAAALVATVTLGLALGANTAIFTVVQALVFSSLAVPEPDRLHQIASTRELPGRGSVEFYNAWPACELIATESRAFAAVGAVQFSDFVWDEGTSGEPRRLLGARASTGAFEAWKIEAALGRVFTAAEEGGTAAPVAVISHRLWQGGFGGAQDVLGRTLRLNGRPHTIVGVLPAGFALPPDTDVWLPQEVSADLRSRGFGPKFFALYGRLAPGVSAVAAQEELLRLSARAAEMDAANREWTFRSRPIRAVLLDGSDRALWLVQAGALVLLALAVSTVASLQLAWTAERRSETAVRLALGAPAPRIVREFLVQSLVLCSAGGALGVGLAWHALPLWAHLNPARDLDFLLQDLALDWGTAGFALALVAATATAAAILPAWQVRRANLADALKSGVRGTATRSVLKAQRAMVVVQAAITVLVLASAAHAGWGFQRLHRASLGFETENRAVFRVQLPAATYPHGADRARFALSFLDEAARHPEVEQVAITTTLPVGDVRQRSGFAVESLAGEFTDEAVPLHTRGVAPATLSALGIPIRRGREFTRADFSTDAAKVAIVSQVVADKHWPGGDPIGRRVRRVTGTNVEFFEIVGVAANVQDAGAGGPPGETIYLPLQHTPPRKISIVVHGRPSAASALSAGRRALRDADPTLALFATDTLANLASQANALPRLQTILLGTFALLAAGIAMLGSYGIMKQLVTNRSREFAVRLALGAAPRELLWTTLGQNARLVLLGACAGLAGALLVVPRLGGAGFTAAHPGWVALLAGAVTLALLQLATLPAALRGVRVDVVRKLAGD